MQSSPISSPQPSFRPPKCPICFEVTLDPVQSEKCLHIFCKSCIGEWLKRDDTCPSCRASHKIEIVSPIPSAPESSIGTEVVEFDLCEENITQLLTVFTDNFSLLDVAVKQWNAEILAGLIAALQKGVRIRSLRFIAPPSTWNKQDGVVTELGECIAENSHIKKLSFERLQLKGNVFSALLNSLKGCESLEYLNLSDNGLNDPEMQEVKALLNSLPQLKEVNLIKNPCSYLSLELFCLMSKELSNPPVIKMDIHGLKMGDSEAASISKILHSRNPNVLVQKLELPENNISGEGIKQLCNGLKEGGHSIEALDLSDNPIGEKGLWAISQFLCNTSKIKVLDLKEANAGDRLDAFLTGLRVNSSLESISFPKCYMDCATMQLLIDVVVRSKKLNFIEMSSLDIDQRSLYTSEAVVKKLLELSEEELKNYYLKIGTKFWWDRLLDQKSTTLRSLNCSYHEFYIMKSWEMGWQLDFAWDSGHQWSTTFRKEVDILKVLKLCAQCLRKGQVEFQIVAPLYSTRSKPFESGQEIVKLMAQWPQGVLIHPRPYPNEIFCEGLISALTNKSREEAIEIMARLKGIEGLFAHFRQVVEKQDYHPTVREVDLLLRYEGGSKDIYPKWSDLVSWCSLVSENQRYISLPIFINGAKEVKDLQPIFDLLRKKQCIEIRIVAKLKTHISKYFQDFYHLLVQLMNLDTPHRNEVLKKIHFEKKSFEYLVKQILLNKINITKINIKSSYGEPVTIDFEDEKKRIEILNKILQKNTTIQHLNVITSLEKMPTNMKEPIDPRLELSDNCTIM